MNVYVVSAKRTAIGTFMGSLSSVSSVELGVAVVKEILKETDIPYKSVNEVIIGQVLTGSLGQNTARQVAIYSGLKEETTAYNIGKVCGSGMQAVINATQSIKLGDSDIVIAGGQENMSMASHASYIRSGVKMGQSNMIDMMLQDGLMDAFSDKHMGITAENIAKKFNITREVQDQIALNSQLKAAKAQKEGKFKEEIVPIKVKVKKEERIFDQDEFVRADTTIERLAKLRPAFDREGTVTAGNSSGINDGAAALMLVSEAALKKYKLKPLAKIISYASAGVSPDIMGTGPVPASKLAIEKAGWKLEDIDLIEANEAFAAQVGYVNNAMGWDINKVNVNGGSIALGHPIGASGARVLVTLIHSLANKNLKKGLATLCIGGGMGIATCVELCD